MVGSIHIRLLHAKQLSKVNEEVAVIFAQLNSNCEGFLEGSARALDVMIGPAVGPRILFEWHRL